MGVPEDTKAELAKARQQYVDDLVELAEAGCGPEFAEWLSSLPDPDTDGVEHD